ncbi:hypothetical protein [Flavobacterium sp.]|uniref:hypothetical protein n=1 Tax=Flavobacterium sp. TaxID=239 RepID=UPI00262C60C0|nr:hypothetical protein [Flavobacterium sp.]
MFNETVIELDKKTTLNFINIEYYSEDVLKVIKKDICKIWNGDNEEDDFPTVKIELQDWFKNKKDDRLIYGFVSEFICHLYLRNKNHEQHFLFRNLEEKGPKKGFDGLYLNENEFWIYESKSTLPNTLSNHNENISLSYNDVKKKIEGENTTNNPWKNAIIHANNYSINRNKSLVENIKSYSKDYVNKVYHNISNFNIIPSSTIYMYDKWELIDVDDLKKKIELLVKKYNARKINVICINKKSIEDFLKFINE